MRRRLPRNGLAQGLFNERLPQYVDMLVPEEARSTEEQEFIGSLRHSLNEHFNGHGLVVAAITSNFQNQGYRILFVNRERRELYVSFSYDEAIRLGEGDVGTKGMFDRIVGLCAERVREQLFAAEGAPSGHA